MDDIKKQIEVAKKLAVDTQLELTAYLDEMCVEGVNRRAFMFKDPKAKLLNEASLSAQRTVNSLGKLLEV